MSWLNADMFASDSIGYFGEIGDNMSMTLDGSVYPPVEILHKTSSLRSKLFFFFSHTTYADHTRLPWNLYPLLYWHLPYISGFVKCSCFALFLYYVRALKINPSLMHFPYFPLYLTLKSCSTITFLLKDWFFLPCL